MPILLFFIFVAVVVLMTLRLGYGLSAVQKRTVSRRCRASHEMSHRRIARRQRERCRFEG